jgi:hypothetical protein
LRTPIDGSADNRPKTIDYPETRERTPAQIGQGAAAMFMVTADERGNMYCGLPNFRPSHDVRVLILNPSGERERVVSFPLMQNGSAHAPPRYLRVAGGVLYTSALGSPIVRYFKLNQKRCGQLNETCDSCKSNSIIACPTDQGGTGHSTLPVSSRYVDQVACDNRGNTGLCNYRTYWPAVI